VRIEVFYIEGCPNREPTVERVKAMLKDLGVAGEVVESPVHDPVTAPALRFLGSPTVQINGVDVEPSARTSNQFGFMCRTYLSGPRREGIPSRALIREALLEAK
jgi:hypothetical protein